MSVIRFKYRRKFLYMKKRLFFVFFQFLTLSITFSQSKLTISDAGSYYGEKHLRVFIPLHLTQKRYQH